MEVYARPQRLVRLPDGRHVNLYCLGERGPVVLLEAGLGGTTSSWRKVQTRLATGFRACAYDRAGNGFSDPGPMPRDTRHMLQDLRAMVRAARLPGPYILVGHSIGGLPIRLYASLYPREVAGLVLVDPSSEHQEARIYGAMGQVPPDGNVGRRACLKAAVAGLKPGTSEYSKCVGAPQPSWPQAVNEAVATLKRSPAYHQTQVSEFESLGGVDSLQIDEAKHSLGDMPLIVLTAENTYRTGIPEAYQDFLSDLWNEMHEETARLSTRGSNRLVRGSGHLIPRDDPVAVVAAVREVAVMAAKR
jgi:pimeloyl-ACP methyl ester carboxylesterase